MDSSFYQTATERIIRETTPLGVQVVPLTSCPAINDYIYCKVPYIDAGSRYVIFWRKQDTVGPARLWRADMERGLLTVISEPLYQLRGFAVSPDQRYFSCSHRPDDRTSQIVRLDIATLECERWAYEELDQV